MKVVHGWLNMTEEGRDWLNTGKMGHDSLCTMKAEHGLMKVGHGWTNASKAGCDLLETNVEGNERAKIQGPGKMRVKSELLARRWRVEEVGGWMN